MRPPEAATRARRAPVFFLLSSFFFGREGHFLASFFPNISFRVGNSVARMLLLARLLLARLLLARAGFADVGTTQA